MLTLIWWVWRLGHRFWHHSFAFRKQRTWNVTFLRMFAGAIKWIKERGHRQGIRFQQDLDPQERAASKTSGAAHPLEECFLCFFFFKSLLSIISRAKKTFLRMFKEATSASFPAATTYFCKGKDRVTPQSGTRLKMERKFWWMGWLEGERIRPILMRDTCFPKRWIEYEVQAGAHLIYFMTCFTCMISGKKTGKKLTDGVSYLGYFLGIIFTQGRHI